MDTKRGKMTLDEAIKERQKVIEVQEKLYEEASTDESKEIIKSATDNDRQLVEWLTELKEAKRLLKAAMEDMKILYETGKDEGCIGIEFKWRYADEALKLLNDAKY